MVKKVSIILLTMIFLFVGLNSSLSEKKLKPGTVITKTVTIPGNKAWTNTGIEVRPQDSITITASGHVYFNEDESSKIDPNGYRQDHYQSDYSTSDFNYCGDPYEQWAHAALIGEVGNSKFLVGTKRVLKGKNGFLYLGINDCSFTEKYYKNSGSFKAIIKVVIGEFRKK
ncbi:MAG: hypothetical protein KAX11_04785 [Candidatus Aminicenantes bacterium]|nr:hypothetical protein [Candidatus Aminicenantes bacterium]